MPQVMSAAAQARTACSSAYSLFARVHSSRFAATSSAPAPVSAIPHHHVSRRYAHATIKGGIRQEHLRGESLLWSLIRSEHETSSGRPGSAVFGCTAASLLNHDVEERSRALTGHGLRDVLDGLRPKLRWTGRGDCRPPTRRPRRLCRRARIPAHARSPSMAARRRDRRGTVAAERQRALPTPVSVSALLITGLSF